jgi:large subunit ribosomal protein L5
MLISKNLKNKLQKIVINSGLGRLSQTPSFEEKVLPEIVKELSLITGQKPVSRPAKKSISGFKLRQGSIIGLQVTLRGKRMMDFLTRLNAIVLPRLRDFRGINTTSITDRGDLSIGLKEQTVFPEIASDQTKVNFGVQITIVPKTKKREEAIDLYRELGVPLKKK